MGVVYPTKNKEEPKHTLRLPVGSTGKLVFQGGPQPWSEKQLAHSKHSKLPEIQLCNIFTTYYEFCTNILVLACPLELAPKFKIGGKRCPNKIFLTRLVFNKNYLPTYYISFTVQVEDSTIAKVVEQKIPHEPSDYIDEHIYDVICLAEGKTEVAFLVGNSKSGTNP